MKVILNVDAITGPLTGIGNYAQQLANLLPMSPVIEELKLYSSHRWIKNSEHALKANQLLASVRKNVPLKGVALNLYTWQKNLWFKKKSKPFDQNYLLHSPNYLLLPFEGKSVTTIHDLSFIRYPETHPKERVALLERELPKSIQQASAIITDSDYIKQEVQQILGVAAEKIHVVPLGVSAEFCPHSSQQNQPILQKYHLHNSQYILSVATLEPRKNLNALIDAYLLLPKAIRAQHKLVIAGARGWLSQDLQLRIQALAKRGDIIALGYIDAADLPYIYSGAFAFALPSLYEGFGLPILEAMAAGTPVLTSTLSCLPEVAAGAAILSNAHDIEDIAAGLLQLIEDQPWRQQAISKGLDRAQHYTWEKCIDKTVEVYQQVIN